MSISENARKFANRHVARNCADGSYNQDTWNWYYRLYFRFIAFDFEKSLCSGITERAFTLKGITEEHADDFVYEHPNIHCERGAICIGDGWLKKLYIEVMTEVL